MKGKTMKYLPWIFILIALAFIGVRYANAGELKMTVTTAAGTLTETVIVPDADLQRMTDAYSILYTTEDENGNPVVPNQVQTFRAMSRGIFRGIRNNVLRVEQEQAAKSAAEAVLPIDTGNLDN